MISIAKFDCPFGAARAGKKRHFPPDCVSAVGYAIVGKSLFQIAKRCGSVGLEFITGSQPLITLRIDKTGTDAAGDRFEPVMLHRIPC
jgi:hypothetical protein